MNDIVERLRQHMDKLWPFAQLVSNTRQPETDNNFGKVVVDCREAADEIERLRGQLDAQATMIAECEDERMRLRGLLREGMEDQISDVASRYEGWPDNEYTKRRILRDSEWARRVHEALGDGNE